MAAKKTTLLCLALFAAVLINAQSAKKIKAHKITSKQIVEIEVERGTNARTFEEFKAFDAEGNVIEYKDYDADGNLKSWVKYDYNLEEEVIKETYLNHKEKIIEIVEYIYKEGLKREKLYFDNKHRLIKKKVYEYTFK